jgi:DnaK suppressor protein
MRREQVSLKLRQVLLRRCNALRESLSGELSYLHTYEEPIVGDFADAALDGDYGLVNAHLAQAESRELARIEHALKRMREGGYGVCEDCGRPIPLARLQALPYATLCIRCQSSAERGLPTEFVSST